MVKDILRWVTIGGLFAVPIILPFIVSGSMFFPYITGKNFTFRIIVEIIFFAWFVLAFLDARYRPKFSWMLSAFMLFVLVIGVADIFGANPFKSFWSNFERMEGYIAILHLFVYFIVAGTVLNTEKLWTAFWYSSLGTSIIIAFIGLKPVVEAFPNIASVRIDATFGNPIYLAVYALFYTFIAFILMDRWRGNVWHRVFLGLVALIHIVTMILTQTRGTVLGFLGGAFIATVLIAIFERDRKVLRVTAIGALLAVVALVGTGFAIKDTEFGRTTPIVSRFTQIELSSGTVHARFMNWGMAWQGAKERPLLGWGQGNYEHVFSKYFDPGMYAEEPWFDRTHNIFFDWLVAGGFLGLIAYLLIPTSLLVHLWLIDPKEQERSLRKTFGLATIKNLFTKRDHAFTATERALWTGLISAYMFHNLFVFDNIISYILFVSVLAYLHWRVTHTHRPLFQNINTSEQTVLTAVLPIVVVVALPLIWYLNYPGIQTSQALIDAIKPDRQLPNGRVVQQTPADMLEHYRRAVKWDQLGRQEAREQLAQAAVNTRRNENVDPEVQRGFEELAMVELERELERNPNSARLWLFAGSLYGGFGQLETSEQAFARAAELSPTKQSSLIQLGEIYLFREKNAEALEPLQKAFELEPEFDTARKVYAIALIRNGRDKEAVDLLNERYGTVAIDDERLFNEWTRAKRFDIAIMILEKRIEENPEDMQLRVSLAAAYKETGDIPTAVRILEEAKQEKPEFAEQMDGFIKELRGW